MKKQIFQDGSLEKQIAQMIIEKYPIVGVQIGQHEASLKEMRTLCEKIISKVMESII